MEYIHYPFTNSFIFKALHVILLLGHVIICMNRKINSTILMKLDDFSNNGNDSDKEDYDE